MDEGRKRVTETPFLESPGLLHAMSYSRERKFLCGCRFVYIFILSFDKFLRKMNWHPPNGRSPFGRCY